MNSRKFLLRMMCISMFTTALSTVNAQDLSEIKLEGFYSNASLISIFENITSEYDVKFIYNKEDLKQIKITRILEDEPLENAIKIFLHGSGFRYEIKNRTFEIFKEGDYSRQNYKPTKFNFTLSGKVVDGKSGESLPFAQIIISGTKHGTASNVDGYFTLFNVPSDTSTLTVVYVGYEKTQVHLNNRLIAKDLNIKLMPKAHILSEVQIEAERKDILQVSEKVSMVKINPKQISTLPSVGEKDLFRSFQLLPGISASGEGSSGLYVRGGTPDQNLILYDGFTVYHVDHLYGMFSAFNSNALKDVQLFKGGFEAKYGGRISSVMEITGKNGNENHFNLGAGIGLMSFNTILETPLSKKSTFFMTFRRSFQSSFYSNIFENFQSSSEDDVQSNMPQKMGDRFMQEVEPVSFFYDLHAKYSYHINKRDIFTLSFYNGQDNLDNSRDNSNMQFGNNDGNFSNETNDLTEWGNWGSSAKWTRKWNSKLYTNTLISYSNYYSQRDRRNERMVEKSGETDTINRGSLEDNELHDYSFKMNNEFRANENNKVEFGWQTSYYRIDYEYTLNDTITIQNRSDKGMTNTLYVQDRMKLFKNLNITPGVRITHYDLTNNFYLEPRFSFNLKLTEEFRLKGAWGKYYQFANRIVRQDLESGARDFWILADDDVVPISSAIHYILGISRETDNYLFDVEAFYKDMDGLSEYSLQYIPSFSNMDYNEYFYTGTGTAKGIEFLLQKKFGKFTGWIAYTLSQTLYNFPIYGENDFYASHDSPHELKLILSYKWKKWTFASTWIYATGKPYTAPTGGYEITTIDGSTRDYLSIGSKNGNRLPDYHRLDLSATYDFNWGQTGTGNINFSIFNLYNRTNTWYKEFEVVEGELIETDVNFLGITPNISLNLNIR